MKLNLARLGLVLVMLTGISGFNIAFNEAGIHSIFNMTMADADANIGLRADLGGMFIALTVFMLLGLIRSSAAWVWPAAIAITAILVVRVVGVLKFGYTDMQGILIGVEIVMIALLSFAAFTFAESSRPSNTLL